MKRLKYLFKIFIVDLFNSIKDLRYKRPVKCTFCKKYYSIFDCYSFGRKEEIRIHADTLIIWNKEAIEKAKNNQLIWMCPLCYGKYDKFFYPNRKIPNNVEVGA